MRFRPLVALLILFIACGFQFWLGSAGIFIDIILASLIAFAFFFDVFELAVFVLLAVFAVNWRSGIGVTILVFALVPFAAYAFHRLSTWTPWAGIPVAIICGFALFYLAIAPRMFLADAPAVVLDVIGSLIFGELVLVALNRAER